MDFVTSALSKLGESAAGGVAILRDEAVPAIGEAGKTITELGQHNLAPLVAGTVASLPEVGAAIHEGGKAAYDFGKRNIGPDTVKKIQKVVQDHPVQVVLMAASGLIVLFPGLVIVPVLGALGWTPLGPSAGSFPSFSFLFLQYW